MNINFKTVFPWYESNDPQVLAPTYFKEKICNQVHGIVLPHMKQFGFKKHTLRRIKGKGPRFRAGMKLVFRTGSRFSAVPFAETVCTGTQIIHMQCCISAIEDHVNIHLFVNEGGRHRPIERDALMLLAEHDGFGDFGDFIKWFLLDQLIHGPGSYELVHWTAMRY